MVVTTRFARRGRDKLNTIMSAGTGTYAFADEFRDDSTSSSTASNSKPRRRADTCRALTPVGYGGGMGCFALMITRTAV